MNKTCYCHLDTNFKRMVGFFMAFTITVINPLFTACGNDDNEEETRLLIS